MVRKVFVLFLLAIGVGAAAEGQVGGNGGLPSRNYGARGTSDVWWTHIDHTGMTAWETEVREILSRRGFKKAQIDKVSRLRTGFFDSLKNGVADFRRLSLPLQFNTELGSAMPMDPVSFAEAIPGCYKEDERECEMKYSAQVGDIYDYEKPCLVPRRTVAACRLRGFVDDDKNNLHKVHSFIPSCGEGARRRGCGADEIVFDDETEQTKLTFSLKKEPSASGSATSAQASRPAKIVYHIDSAMSFVRRDGPARLEEWEYDHKPYVKLQDEIHRAERTSSSRLQSLKLKEKRLFGSALAYCWPHDVVYTCDD